MEITSGIFNAATSIYKNNKGSILRTIIYTIGHFIIAIDIAAFIDVSLFKNNIDEVWSQMKGSTLLPGFDEIRLPGERSHKIYQDRKVNGVPIHSNLKNALDKISDELNIEKIF